MREALPAPSAQDLRNVLAHAGNLAANHPTLAGARIFGDHAKVSRHPRLARNSEGDQPTKILNPTASDLLGQCGSHAAFLFEAFGDVVHDLALIVGVTGRQEAVPTS